MTLNDLKALVETNAVNLRGPVTIVGDCVAFTIREMCDFDVRAYLGECNAIIEVCGELYDEGDVETIYESGEAYAKFLRCEDADAIN